MKVSRILGIGTDIVSVKRMQKIIERGVGYEKRFMSKVLHQIEIKEYENIDEINQKSRYLASRWGLKEATVKACGNRSIYFPGVYLAKYEKSKPKLTIEGETNERILLRELEVSRMHASISHEDEYAVAFVIMETFKAFETF